VGEFLNDQEHGEGTLIDGAREIKGIWKHSVLVEEIVQKTVVHPELAKIEEVSILQQRTKLRSHASMDDFEDLYQVEIFKGTKKVGNSDFKALTGKYELIYENGEIYIGSVANG